MRDITDRKVVRAAVHVITAAGGFRNGAASPLQALARELQQAAACATSRAGNIVVAANWLGSRARCGWWRGGWWRWQRSCTEVNTISVVEGTRTRDTEFVLEVQPMYKLINEKKQNELYFSVTDGKL